MATTTAAPPAPAASAPPVDEYAAFATAVLIDLTTPVNDYQAPPLRDISTRGAYQANQKLIAKMPDGSAGRDFNYLRGLMYDFIMTPVVARDGTQTNRRKVGKTSRARFALLVLLDHANMEGNTPEMACLVNLVDMLLKDGGINSGVPAADVDLSFAAGEHGRHGKYQKSAAYVVMHILLCGDVHPPEQYKDYANTRRWTNLPPLALVDRVLSESRKSWPSQYTPLWTDFKYDPSDEHAQRPRPVYILDAVISCESTFYSQPDRNETLVWLLQRNNSTRALESLLAYASNQYIKCAYHRRRIAELTWGGAIANALVPADAPWLGKDGVHRIAKTVSWERVVLIMRAAFTLWPIRKFTDVLTHLLRDTYDGYIALRNAHWSETIRLASAPAWREIKDAMDFMVGEAIFHTDIHHFIGSLAANVETTVEELQAYAAEYVLLTNDLGERARRVSHVLCAVLETMDVESDRLLPLIRVLLTNDGLEPGIPPALVDDHDVLMPYPRTYNGGLLERHAGEIGPSQRHELMRSPVSIVMDTLLCGDLVPDAMHAPLMKERRWLRRAPLPLVDLVLSKSQIPWPHGYEADWVSYENLTVMFYPPVTRALISHQSTFSLLGAVDDSAFQWMVDRVHAAQSDALDALYGEYARFYIVYAGYRSLVDAAVGDIDRAMAARALAVPTEPHDRRLGGCLYGGMTTANRMRLLTQAAFVHNDVDDFSTLFNARIRERATAAVVGDNVPIWWQIREVDQPAAKVAWNEVQELAEMAMVADTIDRAFAHMGLQVGDHGVPGSIVSLSRAFGRVGAAAPPG